MELLLGFCILAIIFLMVANAAKIRNRIDKLRDLDEKLALKIFAVQMLILAALSCVHFWIR